MKSRKSRKVVLKHPALRFARSVLREALYHAVQAEMNRLSELEHLYRVKRRGKKLTPSQDKRKTSLAHMRQALDYVLEKSTCICNGSTLCDSYKKIYLIKSTRKKDPENPFDLDMAWDPVKKAWYCVKCFDEWVVPRYIENEGRLIDEIPPPMDETEWHIVDNQILPLHEHPKKREREPDMDEYIKYYYIDLDRRWKDYIKDNSIHL